MLYATGGGVVISIGKGISSYCWVHCIACHDSARSLNASIDFLLDFAGIGSGICEFLAI